MAEGYSDSALSRFSRRFRQFGGFRLLSAYARLGILGKAFSVAVKGILKGKDPRQIYSRVVGLAAPVLAKRYNPLVCEVVSRYADIPVSGEKSDTIWFCWLQGLEAAPEVVRKCHSSIVQNFPDRDVKVIDSSNLQEYVTLPEIIRKRHEKGQIPQALLSDMIRLELLLKYGGTWMDSTMFCSGNDCPQEYLDSDLFLFRYYNSGMDFGGISNWFITSCRNHPVLLMLRDLLCRYWEDFDCTLNFFIFHMFFSMIVKERPSLVENMPLGNSRDCLVLEHLLGKPFDASQYEKIVSKSAFHKLTYRLSPGTMNSVGTYYDKLIREG